MEFTRTLPTVLCCECGISIEPNASNMCMTCLRTSIDICEGLQTQLSIHSCRTCKRFLAPPWQAMELESKELMAVCLRKISGINKVKLVDAVWIWTEPHSLRLKIKITVQKEVKGGAILQQSCIVQYVMRNQQCEHCQQQFATGAWHSAVAVRQRVPHKRTFFFLEQLLLKHNAHKECINIVTFKDGMDFYFAEKQQGLRFVEFLEHHVPTKTKYSRKLVSADIKEGTANYKHNHIVEIVPLCKEDLLLLPRDVANKLSDMSQLCLVKSVSAAIHIIDPITAERQELSAEKYWRSAFPARMSSRNFTKFVVLSMEPVLIEQRSSAKRRKASKGKTRLADILVARERDFGVNDTQFTVVSHLGSILRVGDTVVGYDLTAASWTQDGEAERELGRRDMPDVILVRKFYPAKGDREWKLKKLDMDDHHDSQRDLDAKEKDYEDFLQEVAADREMRRNVNVYKKKGFTGAMPVGVKLGDSDAEDGEGDNERIDDEEIRLDELLDDLEIAGDDEEKGEEEPIFVDADTFQTGSRFQDLLDGDEDMDEDQDA